MAIARNPLLDDASRDAADVERPERELRAGLADRLRGDDADGLAQIDHPTGRQVPPIALRADPAQGLALQDRADHDLLDPARFLDRLGDRLGDLLGRAHQDVARRRIDDVLDHGAARRGRRAAR